MLLTTRGWPRESTVLAVTVLDVAAGTMPTFPRVGEILDRWSRLLSRATADLEAVVGALRASGLEARGVIEYGKPGPTIDALCRREQPDLLVVGAWVGAFDDDPGLDLAAELVDRAPCPVLVARRPSIRRLVLCTDGSRAARDAERYVGASPVLRGLPITVLSVVEPHPVVATMLGPRLEESHGWVPESGRTLHRQLAAEAASRLAASGSRVHAQFAAGPIGSQVDDVAIASDADLVVLGADHRRGWSRALLGSVAREVLAHTRVSLLVVPVNTVRPARFGRSGVWRRRRPKATTTALS